MVVASNVEWILCATKSCFGGMMVEMMALRMFRLVFVDVIMTPSWVSDVLVIDDR